MGNRRLSGLVLGVTAALLCVGVLVLVFASLPIATCPTCDGLGKYRFTEPDDVVIDPGSRGPDGIRMKKIEHRPAINVRCHRCRGEGRMTYYRRWTGPVVDTSDAGILHGEPEGPITTSEVMPDDPPVKKGR